MNIKKYAVILAVALFISSFDPGPSRALTMENTSDAVLYCSVYRQGYPLPLAQFVLLPGQQRSWSSTVSHEVPLVVRAMAERHLVRPVAPATCTVHNHLATVVADQVHDALTLDVRAP